MSICSHRHHYRGSHAKFALILVSYYIHVKTVKGSTTQREKSPAFFIVRMSFWVKEKATLYVCISRHMEYKQQEEQ